VAIAAEHGIPLLPRGAGTSLAGNSVGAALVIDFTKHMHRVLDLDPSSRRVRVEPGVVVGRLNRALAAHGLVFGPDPATKDRAVLGGMVSGGLAMALFQRWRFKRVGFPAKGWILASTFGWGVGGGLLGVGLIGGGDVFEHWLDTALVAAAGGALAGIMQAGVLGVVTTQAGWWPWLSVAGLPGGLALGGILATLNGSDDEVVILAMLVVGAIGWWVVSAAGLTWLVGSLDPRTTARDDRAIARGAAVSRAIGYAFAAWFVLRMLTKFL